LQQLNTNNNYNYRNNKHAYAGQLNSFTHVRALLVLHDCNMAVLACPESWLKKRETPFKKTQRATP
jgi:hypothetical protein